MLRATDVIARGDWEATPYASVVLDFEDRNRRRIAMETVGGEKFLLDLPEPVALRTGDALQLEDGRLIEVVGQPEPLAEIRAESPERLAVIAWHLGNRHLTCQVVGQRIRIRRDHVIEGMVGILGGTVRIIEAAFDPEGGAYTPAKRKKAADHVHDAHVHDENCGCGHDHHHHAHGAHHHPHHDHGDHHHGHEKHDHKAHDHKGHHHAHDHHAHDHKG